MSLDNHRNLKLALARDPLFLEVAEEVAGEMNRWAQGFFGRPIIADWRQQLDFTTVLYRCPGPPPGRPAHPAPGRRGVLRLHRGPGAVRREQPGPAPGRGPQRRPLPAQDPDRRGGRLLERLLLALEAHLGLPAGTMKVLRAGGADGAVLPAHGDPGRPGAPLRGLQHRPLGLHQQRLGRPGLGPGLREPQHRRHHHDLRLHAGLRGPGAPGREHPGPQGPLRPLAGRHGAQHPRGLRGGRGREHGAGRGRRRARAARGRLRQVGGPLEDGPHRAPGLGEGGRGQPAGPRLPGARPTGRRTPRA